jgi:Rod binding domain-containing protein
MTGIPAVISKTHEAMVAQPRLVRAAHEFEAQLMKELLKPMADADADGGPMAEYASEALGQAISMRGGLGLASSIIASLCRNGTGPGSASDLRPGRAASGRVDGARFK